VDDPARDCIKIERRFTFVRRKHLSWPDILSVRVWGKGAFVIPKVGLDLVGPEFTLWLNEWDEAFAQTFVRFGLNQRLPRDWYSRAELGEAFNIKIAENSA